MPDSIFFSDKTVLSQTKKSRIVEVSVWVDNDDIPNIVQFRYQDEKKKHIEGIQPVPYPPSSLELNVFKLKEGDYLHKIKGTFFEGQLLSLHLISKYGKQMKFEGELAQSEGQLWSFEPRPNQIPSSVFGAYVRKQNDDYRMCYLGMEFITDW